ncbi:CRISPR-associated endonuclease Cas2 [Paraneptunicella aestuarii]|uniref:CRISPR-associated endonuclease Cas2 n=1 Tax=Paraneptunicella aestuarii TaxID=2831148 RepID=UPI001E358A6A|nr:CRISPR-associated endonuclease Cas2 [Paraneptunicella aestuarii]UAA40361.1 CRISPR-associated endonuclease Cas2 [Paraneptunicella aestuarii]
MAGTLSIYVVCFDISDDKVRRNVVKALMQYGDRVQYSVFELAFKRLGDMQKMQIKLEALLEPGDEIRFYRLCHQCRKTSKAIPDKPLGYWPAAILIH